MQSMTYLKQMGPIANLFIMLSQVVFWKKYKILTDLYLAEKRDGFLRHFHESEML